ncbi:hypothetical protein CEXT_145781 [Caerostris extrusa]|uniref:Secreted protein n=1 Tax=Caerostris extrusa TaxID=172846 RepID=A0AAV4W8G0_CAEEX|nr:hypothetical protein CEXT_145781 [Caerostris extrusa]
MRSIVTKVKYNLPLLFCAFLLPFPEIPFYDECMRSALEQGALSLKCYRCTRDHFPFSLSPHPLTKKKDGASEVWREEL